MIARASLLVATKLRRVLARERMLDFVLFNRSVKMDLIMNENYFPQAKGLEELEGEIGSIAALETVDVPGDGAIGRLSEYVPVIFARHAADAENYKCVLEDLGVPTLIESDNNAVSPLSVLSRRVPVLVPGEMLEDASEIIARVEQRISVQLDNHDGVDDNDDNDDRDEYDDDEDDEDDDDDDDDEDEDL